tara:strand:- start:520 stop:1392 length:873 start_codon:yes stop_codon:yes gene_type:complete
MDDIRERLDLDVIGIPWLTDWAMIGRQSPTGLTPSCASFGTIADDAFFERGQVYRLGAKPGAVIHCVEYVTEGGELAVGCPFQWSKSQRTVSLFAMPYITSFIASFDTNDGYFSTDDELYLHWTAPHGIEVDFRTLTRPLLGVSSRALFAMGLDTGGESVRVVNMVLKGSGDLQVIEEPMTSQMIRQSIRALHLSTSYGRVEAIQQMVYNECRFQMLPTWGVRRSPTAHRPHGTLGALGALIASRAVDSPPLAPRTAAAGRHAEVEGRDQRLQLPRLLRHTRRGHLQVGG